MRESRVERKRERERVVVSVERFSRVFRVLDSARVVDSLVSQSLCDQNRNVFVAGEADVAECLASAAEVREVGWVR